MLAGYSGKTLLDKLGIKTSMKILLIHPPGNYDALLGKDISAQCCGQKEVPDFIHLFTRSLKEFYTATQKLQPVIASNPQIIIWVSWYKKSSKIPTDINEDLIRAWALENGLVDIKVCAVSEEWSGLKLVVPLKKRKAR
ncbi:MAG TPA: hypothetical protein VFX58_13710 [Chitinophagaceae bacterium]|nr:hypothetical protein [Chitinophagaceae bacterium]